MKNGLGEEIRSEKKEKLGSYKNKKHDKLIIVEFLLGMLKKRVENKMGDKLAGKIIKNGGKIGGQLKKKREDFGALIRERKKAWLEVMVCKK